VLLLGRHCHGPSFLCLRLGDALVGLRLVRLQAGAGVLADVHVDDADGQDFERCASAESLG
jgi:hypothetical protein